MSFYRRRINPAMERMLNLEIHGLPRRDWLALGKTLIAREMEISNADDMDAVVRDLKRDARFAKGDRISKSHLWLAMALIQMGRRSGSHDGT